MLDNLLLNLTSLRHMISTKTYTVKPKRRYTILHINQYCDFCYNEALVTIKSWLVTFAEVLDSSNVNENIDVGGIESCQIIET